MSEELVPKPGLIERMFFTPVYRTGLLPVLGWWESRRPIFNLAVGAAGLTSLATLFLLAPPELADSEWRIGVVLYAVMANVLYSLGAPADLLLRKWLGPRAAAAGPAIFRYGFVFGVGLSLLPIPVAIYGFLIRHLVGR